MASMVRSSRRATSRLTDSSPATRSAERSRSSARRERSACMASICLPSTTCCRSASSLRATAVSSVESAVFNRKAAVSRRDGPVVDAKLDPASCEKSRGNAAAAPAGRREPTRADRTASTAQDRLCRSFVTGRVRGVSAARHARMPAKGCRNRPVLPFGPLTRGPPLVGHRPDSPDSSSAVLFHRMRAVFRRGGAARSRS